MIKNSVNLQNHNFFLQLLERLSQYFTQSQQVASHLISKEVPKHRFLSWLTRQLLFFFFFFFFSLLVSYTCIQCVMRLMSPRLHPTPCSHNGMSCHLSQSYGQLVAFLWFQFVFCQQLHFTCCRLTASLYPTQRNSFIQNIYHRDGNLSLGNIYKWSKSNTHECISLDFFLIWKLVWRLYNIPHIFTSSKVGGLLGA